MHVRVERGDRVERALHLARKDDTPHQEGASCHGVSHVLVGVAPVGQHMRRDERERITLCIIRCRVEVLIGLRVRQFGGRCAAVGISGIDAAFAQEGNALRVRHIVILCRPYAARLFCALCVSWRPQGPGMPQ